MKNHAKNLWKKGLKNVMLPLYYVCIAPHFAVSRSHNVLNAYSFDFWRN